MANYMIHEAMCCFCKKLKLVYNHQCGDSHIQPTLICEDCAREIADELRDYVPPIDDDD